MRGKGLPAGSPHPRTQYRSRIFASRLSPGGRRPMAKRISLGYVSERVSSSPEAKGVQSNLMNIDKKRSWPFPTLLAEGFKRLENGACFALVGVEPLGVT